MQEWEIDLFIDLATNLFGHPGDKATNVRAKSINTIDEVPDSNWFTNRILAKPAHRAGSVARSPHRHRAGAGTVDHLVTEAGGLRSRIHDA